MRLVAPTRTGGADVEGIALPALGEDLRPATMPREIEVEGVLCWVGLPEGGVGDGAGVNRRSWVFVLGPVARRLLQGGGDGPEPCGKGFG